MSCSDTTVNWCSRRFPNLKWCLRVQSATKFLETLSSYGVTLANEIIHIPPPPPPIHSKLGCLLFSIRSSNSGTTLHGGGGGGKDLFCPFEVGKTSEWWPFRAKCLNFFQILLLIAAYIESDRIYSFSGVKGKENVLAVCFVELAWRDYIFANFFNRLQHSMGVTKNTAFSVYFSKWNTRPTASN